MPRADQDSALLLIQPVHQAQEVFQLDGGCDIARQGTFSLTVDPGCVNPQLRGGNHVVEEALSGVQPSVGTDTIAGGMEVGVCRLVGSDLLGRDGEIERDAEMAAGRRQKIVVDIRENSQPIAGHG